MRHLEGWADAEARLARALGATEGQGVVWRGTRFDRYLQHIRELAALDSADVARRPGEAMTWEALAQGVQLADASALFNSIPPAVLVKKLTKILDGADLSASDECGDEPRNTLFEFTVAGLLASCGFRVDMTADDEDVIAFHEAIPEPVSVECKHPALASTPRQAKKRVLRSLTGIRAQLAKRDPRHLGMGALGMAGLYGVSSAKITWATDAAALSDMVDRALTAAVASIRRINATNKLGLESRMHIGAVVFVGPGLCGEGTGYVISKARFFVLGNDLRLERALSSIVGGGS